MEMRSVLEPADRQRFERLILPHQDAAFNLARWVLRSRADAEDVTQDALVRAFRFIAGFHGTDERTWLLQIVRNACYSWLEKNRRADLTTEFDETVHLQAQGQATQTPEAAAVASNERERLMRALESLPARSREGLVLRELGGCSYKGIATVTSVPIGTVMCTLGRGRDGLKRLIRPASGTDAGGEKMRHEM